MRGRPKLEVSEAAIAGFVRLRATMRRQIEIHASDDGGLICEDRTSPARPTLWRVSPDGDVLPDSPYNYYAQSFVPASRLPD
jgi:hypothetical protein